MAFREIDSGAAAQPAPMQQLYVIMLVPARTARPSYLINNSASGDGPAVPQGLCALIRQARPELSVGSGKNTAS